MEIGSKGVAAAFRASDSGSGGFGCSFGLEVARFGALRALAVGRLRFSWDGFWGGFSWLALGSGLASGFGLCSGEGSGGEQLRVMDFEPAQGRGIARQGSGGELGRGDGRLSFG